MSDHSPLGVLLVHGIGEQQAGDTLLEFTEPLEDFCAQWVAGAGDSAGTVTVSDTQLRREEGDGPAPSHTRLHASVDGRGEMTWLVAESRWAERFPVPSFGQLLGWLFSVVAPVTQRHIDSRLLLAATDRSFRNLESVLGVIAGQEKASAPGRNEGAYFLRFLLGGNRKIFPWLRRGVLGVIFWLQNIVSVVLGTFVLLCLLALMPLGLFPRTRRTVLRVQAKLANSLGDSFVLLRSPLRRDAMVSQIERDIDWLESQGCEKIAVIAHSQGAEVARLALVRRPHTKEPVGLFLTFGAGIEKLDAVRQLADQLGKTWGVHGLRTVSVAAAGAVAFAGVPGWVSALLLAVSGVSLFAAYRIGRHQVTPMTKAQLGGSCLDAVGTTWLDLYASSDPVPEGRLDLGGDNTSSLVIHNRRSTMRDHTTYWQNTEEFVARVAFALARKSGWSHFDLLRSDDRSRVRRAIAERRRRTEWLLHGRWSAGLTGLLVVLLAREQVVVSKGTGQMLGDVPGLPASLAKTLTRWGAEQGVRAWIGALLAVAVVGAFHWAVTARVWGAWDRSARGALTARATASASVQILYYVVVAVPPVAATIALLTLADMQLETGPLALGVLAGLAVARVVGPMVRRRWREPVPRRLAEQLGDATTGDGVISDLRPIGERNDSEVAAPVIAHGSAWIATGADRAVVRIPDGDGENSIIPVEGKVIAMAASERGVWVTTDESQLVHIDAAGEPDKCVDLNSPSPALAAAAGRVWTIDSDNGRVVGFPLGDGQIVRSGPLPKPIALAAGNGHVWVSDRLLHGVVRFDASDLTAEGRRMRIPMGLAPTVMHYTPDGLWLWFRSGLVGRLSCDDGTHTLGSVWRSLRDTSDWRGQSWLLPVNGKTLVLRGRDGQLFTVEQPALALTRGERVKELVTGATHGDERILVTVR
jgi:hypothetical protein